MIDEAIEETCEMQTYSSPAVAVKAMRVLVELTERNYTIAEEFERDLERNVGASERMNPPHALLYDTLQDVFHSVRGEADGLDEARELTLSTIDRMVEIAETGKRHTTQQTAVTIEDGQTLLIHDYSSAATEAIEFVVADGAQLTIYVTKARPRFLGRKFTREFVAIDDVESHLMVDGTFRAFPLGCDHAIIGMDCIVKEAPYNHIRTSPFITIADKVGVPVMIVGSSVKIAGSGLRFENEIRPPSEAIFEPVEGVELENPACDTTPVDLIDEVAIDEGVIEF